MPYIRNVLTHVALKTAKRRQDCDRIKNHSIRKGEQCLTVKASATHSKRQYCRKCALEILTKASNRLDEIRINFETIADDAPLIHLDAIERP